MKVKCINSENYSLIARGQYYYVQEKMIKRLTDNVSGYCNLIGEEMTHYLLSEYNNDHWYPYFLFKCSLPLNTNTKVL